MAVIVTIIISEFISITGIYFCLLQSNSVGTIDSNASFRRKLSKREKKQLKKQEKLSRMKSENGDVNDKDGVAEKLYTGNSFP